MLYKKSCSKRSKFASQKCHARCHIIGYFFVLSPANSTPLWSLQRSPVPLAMRRWGEGLPPLFKLLGFHYVASPYTKLSSVVYRKITWLQIIFVLIRLPVSFESINGSGKHYCVSIFFSRSLISWSSRKITTRCHILKLKCTKFDFGWGCGPPNENSAYATVLL